MEVYPWRAPIKIIIFLCLKNTKTDYKLLTNSSTITSKSPRPVPWASLSMLPVHTWTKTKAITSKESKSLTHPSIWPNLSTDSSSATALLPSTPSVLTNSLILEFLVIFSISVGTYQFDIDLLLKNTTIISNLTPIKRIFVIGSFLMVLKMLKVLPIISPQD